MGSDVSSARETDTDTTAPPAREAVGFPPESEALSGGTDEQSAKPACLVWRVSVSPEETRPYR
jgi:hypothetical protein